MRTRPVGESGKEKRIKRKEVGGERVETLSAHFGVINLKNSF